MADQRRGRPVLSSLGAFLRAGLRPSTPLQKAIATALLIKLIVVVAMRSLLFSEDVRVPVNDRALETQLLVPAARQGPRP